MTDAVLPIQLWIQLAVAAGFVLVMVIVHGLGLLGISRILKLDEERLVKHRMDIAALLLVGTTGVLLFLLHFLEIVIFALFYLALEPNFSTFEDTLYYSASAYATLGIADADIERGWRLIGAFEAVIGFVLIGWSTAFVARVMAKLQA